ncbi:tetratricopeptide repeat protein [Flavobacteriaceae bacterium LMO-SS05]
MKTLNHIIITLICFTTLTYAQSGVHTQSFSGELNGANIAGIIKYKPDCYLGNPYISVAIGNVKIVSYHYQGKSYSGKAIPNYSFPLQVKDGYLMIESTFRYGSKSSIYASPVHFTINSGIDSDKFIQAFTGEQYFGGFTNPLKVFLKSHGIDKCSDDWGRNLGNIISLSITGGGLDGVDRELENAIKKLLKDNKVKELLRDANSQFSASNYDAAEGLYRDVLREDFNNQEAKNKLEEIKEIKKNAKLENEFNAFIESGDNYAQQEDYSNAIDQYKRALSTGFNNSEAQRKIDNAKDAEEARIENLKIEKEKAEANKQAETLKKEEDDKLKEAENKLDNARTHINQGDTYSSNKQYKEAIREYKKALELDPENATLKAHINNIETQLNKIESDKVANERRQEEAQIEAQKDAQIDRDRLKAQQEDFDNQIKAAEYVGEYLTSSLDIIIQQDASYSNYKRNIESVTRIKQSDDPYQVISDFNSKLAELERLSVQRHNQRIKEINASYAQQSTYNTTAMEQAGTDIGTMIVKMSLPKQIEKEKAAAKEKLEDQKRTMLSKIKDKRIKEFESNKNSYNKRAASEIDINNEEYYNEMAEYYQCKMDKSESRFSIDHTDWVNPDCDEVKSNYSQTSDTPTGRELYLASLRKFKNANKYYQSASKSFVEMAIKESPKVADYYFHRAKFEEVGTINHIALMNKTLELDPKNLRAKDYLEFSIAEKKRFDETAYFDSNWKVTKRNQATYYRPLVGKVENLFHIKDYYASNDQLQMEGYASMFEENTTATFVGKVSYYFESGKIDNEVFYDNGLLKQRIDYNKNGKAKIEFYEGRNNSVFSNGNYGDIVEVNYSESGFIKYLKWNYTGSHKKKNYKFYSFACDDNGTLLFRDVYNDNGKLKDKIVADNITAIHRASQSYISAKEYSDAIKLLEHGITLFPEDAIMYYYLGIAKGNNEGILSSINSTISKKINVTISSKMSKNNEEAIANFDNGIRYAKNDPDLLVRLHEELGNLYFKVNDFNKSEQAFNNGLDINPQDASLLNSYSLSLAKRVQRLDEAEQMINLCNEVSPNQSEFQDTFAWVLYKQGKYGEAINWINKAINNGGQNVAIVWEHKGDTTYKLGDKDGAIGFWKTAKSLSKGDGGEVSDFLNQKIKKKILIE